MFGLSKSRAVLAAAAIAVLLALNFWQYGGAPGGRQPVRDWQAFVPPDLAPIALAADRAANRTGPAARNLFRANDQPVVLPEPKPAPVAAPAPDPQVTAIAAAEKRLEGVFVLGLLSASQGMVAVVEKDGNVGNVVVGQELIPGFVVSAIGFEKITVFSQDLGITRDLKLGGTGGN